MVDSISIYIRKNSAVDPIVLQFEAVCTTYAQFGQQRLQINEEAMDTPVLRRKSGISISEVTQYEVCGLVSTPHKGAGILPSASKLRRALVSNKHATQGVTGSRDSSVGTATGYGLDDRRVGVRVPVGARIFSSPRRPDRFWGLPSVLSNGYRGLFPRV
jgi:hypothetical protein